MDETIKTNDIFSQAVPNTLRQLENIRQTLRASYQPSAFSNILNQGIYQSQQLYSSVFSRTPNINNPSNVFEGFINSYKQFIALLTSSAKDASKELTTSARKVGQSSNVFNRAISKASKALTTGFSIFGTAADVFMGMNLLRTGKQVAYTLARGFSTSKYAEDYAESLGVDLTAYRAIGDLPDILVSGPATRAFSNLAVGSYAEVEAAQSRVKTILPKEQWQSNPELIKNTLSRLNNALSQTEAYDIQYQILSAGFMSAAESAKVLEAAVKLTKAGFADANEAGSLLVSTMQAYGASAEEAANYAAKLMAIVNNGITTIPELSGVFGQLASVASQAGVSIDDLGAAIAVLTQRGQRTAVAATSISSLIMGLVSPTPQAEKALKRYAAMKNKVIDINPATLREKGLTETLQEIYEVTEGNPQALSEIFTEKTAYRAAVGLLADRGKRMKDFKQSIGESGAKFLEDVFQVSLGNQRERIVSIINKTKDTLVSLGKELSPVYEGFLQAMEKVADAMNKMPDPLKKTLGFIIQMRLATSQLFDVISSILGAVTTIASFIISNKIFNVLIGLISSPAGTDTVGGRIKSAAQVGHAQRALLQELIGIDSKYATVVATLEKKGVSRANAEFMVNKALKERVDIMKLINIEEEKLMKNDATVRRFSKFMETMGVTVGGQPVSPLFLKEAITTTQRGQSLTLEQRQKYLEAKQQRKAAETRLESITQQLSVGDLTPKERRRLEQQQRQQEKRLEKYRAAEQAQKERFLQTGRQTQANARLVTLFDSYASIAAQVTSPDFDLNDTTNRQAIRREVNRMAQTFSTLTGTDRQTALQTIYNQIDAVQGSAIRRQLLSSYAEEYRQARRTILADTSLDQESRTQRLRGLKATYKSNLDELGLLSAPSRRQRTPSAFDISPTVLGIRQPRQFSPESLLLGASALATSGMFLSSAMDLGVSAMGNKVTTDQLLGTAFTGLMAAGTVGSLLETSPGVRRFLNPKNWWGILTGNETLNRPRVPLGAAANAATLAFRGINQAAGMQTIAQSGKFLGMTVPGLSGLAGAAAAGGLAASAAGTLATGGLLAAAFGLGKINFDKYFEAKGAEEKQKELEVSINESIAAVKNSIDKIQSLTSVIQDNTQATTANTSALEKMLESSFASQMGTASDVTTTLLSRNVQAAANVKTASDARKLLESKDYAQLTDAELLAISKLAQSDPTLAAQLSGARERSFVKEYGSIKFNPIKFFMDNSEAAVRQYSAFVEGANQLQQLTSKNLTNLNTFFNYDFVEAGLQGKQVITPQIQEEIRNQRLVMKKQLNQMAETVRQQLAEINKAIEEEVKKGTPEQSLKLRQLRQASEAGRELLRQAEEAAKQANIAYESGQDQIDNYTTMFRNVDYNRRFKGDYRGARKEIVEKELQGFQSAKQELLKQIESGTATGDFMAALKNNISQQLDSIVTAFEEGYYSYEEALKRIEEATTAKIKDIDILSPQERAELEAQIIDFAMKKIEAEQRYLEILKQVKQTIETIPYERQAQAAETLKTLLDYRGSIFENTTNTVRESIQRLSTVIESPIARGKLDAAQNLFAIESRRMDLENIAAQVQEAKSRIAADQKRLDIEAETKAKQYEKEIEKRQLELGKKNITVERREQLEQELKLLKAEQELLSTSTAEQKVQLQIRRLLLEVQEESLGIQKQFLEQEEKITERLGELRMRSAQLDYLQEAYGKTQSFIQTVTENAPISEATKLQMQVTDLQAQEDILDRRYEIEKEVVKLLSEQNKLALERQRIENEIAETKLRAERAAVAREMRAQTATGKNRELIETYRTQLNSIDQALTGIQRTKAMLERQRAAIESATASELEFKQSQYELNKSHLRMNKEFLTSRRSSLLASERATGAETSEQQLQLLEAARAKRAVVFDFINQVAGSAPEYSKRQLQIEQLKSEEEYLTKKLAIEQQIYEINVKKQEISLQTQKAELELAEELLRKENARLELEKRRTKDKERVKDIEAQISFNNQSIATMQDVSKTVSESLAQVKATNEKQLRIQREQNQLQIDAIRGQREILQAQQLREGNQGAIQVRVDALNLTQQRNQLAQTINSTRQSVINELASIGSQYASNEAAAYKIQKQAQDMSIEIQRQQLNLKEREINIATELQKIEIATAKARLETEMKILEAKREQLRMAGASKEELSAMDNIISGMAQQRNVFEQSLAIVNEQRRAQLEGLQFERGLLRVREDQTRSGIARRYDDLYDIMSHAGIFNVAPADMPASNSSTNALTATLLASRSLDIKPQSLVVSEQPSSIAHRVEWSAELKDYVLSIKENVRGILDVNKDILEVLTQKANLASNTNQTKDNNRAVNILETVTKALSDINNRA